MSALTSVLKSSLSKFRRKTQSSAYLPEVDGLRFLAIAWVVLFHLQGSMLKKISGIATSDNPLHFVFVHGDQGVYLFFVISGFILCLPFAKQYALAGSPVNLRSYYVRRVVRIEPPYVITCIILFLLLVARNKFTAGELLPHLGASLVYLHSLIFNGPSLINVVFWSLEVEVQFYILAPFLTAAYFYFSKNVRRIGAAALVIAIPLLQQMLPPLPFFLFTFLHYFLIGFIVCDLYIHREDEYFKHNWLIPAGLILVMFMLNSHDSVAEEIALPFIMGLLFLFVLFQSRWKKFFGLPVLAAIGGMCYSIYLIHFQIIAVVGDVTMRYNVGTGFYMNLAIQSLVLIPVVLIVSAVFYLLIERPFMNIKP